jgi:hypothetical protein
LGISSDDSELGVEEVGVIRFAPEYYTEQQIADLEAVWTRQGWDKASGYPPVSIMKWRGDDAIRPEATRRFILESQEGLGIRGNANIDQQQATAERVLGGDGARDEGDGVAGEGDRRTDPRRFADRARGVSGAVRSYVENILAPEPLKISAGIAPAEIVPQSLGQPGVRKNPHHSIYGCANARCEFSICPARDKATETMVYRTNVLFALVFSFLSACATNAGGYRSETDVVERLRQMNKDEVALKLGAPSNRITVDETKETWTYDTALVSIIGGQCKVSISFEGDKVTDAVVNSFDYSPVAAPMGSCRQIIRALD